MTLSSISRKEVMRVEPAHGHIHWQAFVLAELCYHSISGLVILVHEQATTLIIAFLQEMSPLLGNQEHNLTLSWQNFTVKVKRRQVDHGSTGAWLRRLISWKNAEEVTILENGELKQKVLFGNVCRCCCLCSKVGNPVILSVTLEVLVLVLSQVSVIFMGVFLVFLSLSR